MFLMIFLKLDKSVNTSLLKDVFAMAGSISGIELVIPNLFINFNPTLK
jgi:hypothetical protein